MVNFNNDWDELLKNEFTKEVEDNIKSKMRVH